MVDAWYRLVHDMVQKHILCWYVGFSRCLVEACVGDGVHLVKRFPWYMTHVKGSNDRLVMESVGAAFVFGLSQFSIRYLKI
jgi:hypothetical protein